MSGTGNEPILYRVSYSVRVREQLVELGRVQYVYAI